MDTFSGVMTLGFITVFILVGAVFYFIPGILALLRHHPNAGAIVVLNLFLGWTVLGWVGALVWACTAIPEPNGRAR